MPTKRESAHAKLKEKLALISDGVHFIFELDWKPPTCLKCEGFLSKIEGSPNLICFKCGAKFELKEC